MEQFLQIGLRVPDAVQEQQDHPRIQARITVMDMTMLVAHFVVHRIVRVAKTGLRVPHAIAVQDMAVNGCQFRGESVKLVRQKVVELIEQQSDIGSEDYITI